MIKYNNIYIKNIYYMLSYAYRSLSASDIREMGSESFENIHDMFAHIVLSEMSRIIKRGLYRTYITTDDRLSVIRGKIILADTMRNIASNKKIISCEYDEFSENNIYNQVIKTTIIMLIRQDKVSHEKRRQLRKLLVFLDNVEELPINQIKWDTIKVRKENQNYRFIMVACDYILNGLVFSDSEGRYRMNDFIDDQKMHHLYEKFILEYYRYHYSNISAAPIAVNWDLDDGFSDFLPKMQTDITLRYKGKVLIIDAKFYSHIMQQRFDNYSIHSGNLYQIFAYVKNYDRAHTGNVAGMLLYAKTDERIFPNQTYQMSGNEISVKTLDLNADFETISGGLNNIVSNYFGI